MKNEINYYGYLIYFQCGHYWVDKFKTPFETVRQAKEYIDFIEEEILYLQ